MSDLNNGISRRSVLKGAAVGGIGLAAGGSLLAGCGDKATGPLAYGARSVDAGPTAQNEALIAAYTAKTKNEVKYNATESNAFQNNLSQYLQGTPDDTFEWMAGYRMQFFAEQGLLADLTGVWDAIGDQYTESYKIASTGLDGKQYFVPKSWYPWGLHFRKSMFADLGLNADNVTNWDEYLKMLDGMKKKGLVGFAAGDKGGWEAMGTFDILNARINGYQFHVDLLAGREKWTDAKVTEVFTYWSQLIPYMNPNVLDLEWDGAMQLLLQKKAGSMLMGSWFGGNFKEQSEADYLDLSIIPFPEINPEHGRDTIDAPIDGYCVAANGTNNEGGADFLKFALSARMPPTIEYSDTLASWQAIAKQLRAAPLSSAILLTRPEQHSSIKDIQEFARGREKIFVVDHFIPDSPLHAPLPCGAGYELRENIFLIDHHYRICF